MSVYKVQLISNDCSIISSSTDLKCVFGPSQIYQLGIEGLFATWSEKSKLFIYESEIDEKVKF